MNWTDMFPVLDEDLLQAYEDEATGEEKAELEEWFGVARVIRAPRWESQPAPTGADRHIVSVSVFWKHMGAKDPDLPVPTRERLVHARRMGLVKRFDPWETYIEPLFSLGAEQIARNPEVEFRAYLASDLEFLLDDFLEAGWDVHLMKSPSLRYCPGGFWRFLALEEDALVSMVDADRVGLSDTEILRTKTMSSMGLGLWRTPGYYNQEPTKEGWCAFIDMDEFLLPFAPMEELLQEGAVRIRQKKFADRVESARVLDCERTFTIDTRGWATKLIMDMAHYVPGRAAHVHDLHSARPTIDLPLERMRFNHYNHGRVGHEWLLDNWRNIDPEWQPVPYEKTFDERCTAAKDRAREWVRHEDFVPVPMRRPGDNFT